MLKKKKIYDFNYVIYWKDGSQTIGEVIDSKFPPADILLTKKMNYYSSGKAYYYNSNEIKLIEVTNIVEKVEK